MNLKKRKRLIAKLVKIQEGDQSKFLYNHVRDDGKGLGFNKYTIEQLVAYKGFHGAQKTALEYRKSANRNYSNCTLVKSYVDIFHDCYRGEITTESCVYHVVVDLEGRLMNPDDELMYREWEAGEKLSYQKWEAKWWKSFQDEVDCEFRKEEL